MVTAPTPAPASLPEHAPMSAFARITGVFANPKTTFADIAARPSWVAPMVVMILVALALSITLNQRVDWVQVMERQINRSPSAAARMEQVPADQRDKILQQRAGFSKVFRYVRGFIGTPFLVAFSAAIYLALFNLFCSARLRYSLAFTVITFALLPIALKEILAIPIVLFKDPSAIDPENIVASNIAAFLPGDAPLWQTALGASFDIFAIWSAILTAIGFSAANPKKITLGKGFAVVGGVWVFFTLLVLGLVGAFA